LTAGAAAGSRAVITVPSAAMRTEFKATVVIPSSYEETSKHYPVIYLLHGYAGDHRVWSRLTDMERLADRYDIMFVCPSGGHASWYIDSPIDSDSRYETHIVREVIPYIDRHYRTIDDREGRALIGSSMGGYGALMLLCAHPGMFRGAGSISGIMDLTAFTAEWGIADVLGPYETNRKVWERYSFLRSAHQLHGKRKAIMIDCGTSDFAIEGNRKTHEQLLENNIDHVYCERPGQHSSRYVAGALEYHVMFLERELKDP
jgi:S-formylglutathione hydrolase FrmB